MNKPFVSNQYMSNSFKEITFDKNIKIYIEFFISKKKIKLIGKKEIINKNKSYHYIANLISIYKFVIIIFTLKYETN